MKTRTVTYSRTAHLIKRPNRKPESCGPLIRTRDHQAADVPILNEALFALDLVLLHAAPLYYGVGIPHGDGSAVVLIPGFLCPDVYLAPLHEWLRRIGYKPFFSGIGVNTECPNLLISRQLNATIDRAIAKSGRKIHLIGHSLGGDRACDRIAAAHRRRIRHHVGRPLSRNRGSRGHSGCGRDGAKAHPGKARFGSPSCLLYPSLHLRLFGSAELRNVVLGVADCGLYRR